MPNPFSKSPYYEDYYRYCQVRPLSYNEGYLFAESLTRPAAVLVAKKLAKSFDISVKVESLSVRQLQIWLREDAPEPLLDWIINTDMEKWAVTLYHLKKEQLADLWKCWRASLPFNDVKEFEDWFQPYAEGFTSPATDPALAIWLRLEPVEWDLAPHSESISLPRLDEAREQLNTNEYYQKVYYDHVQDDTYEDMED